MCHGLDGAGDTGTGRRHHTRDFSDSKVKSTLRIDAMIKAIKEGVVYQGFNVMSPFSGDLSDDEIKALAEYMMKF